MTKWLPVHSTTKRVDRTPVNSTSLSGILLISLTPIVLIPLVGSVRSEMTLMCSSKDRAQIFAIPVLRSYLVLPPAKKMFSLVEVSKQSRVPSKKD